MNTEAQPVRLVQMDNGEVWFFNIVNEQWRPYKRFIPEKLIEGNDLIVKVEKTDG